jgi:hypothetical protein
LPEKQDRVLISAIAMNDRTCIVGSMLRETERHARLFGPMPKNVLVGGDIRFSQLVRVQDPRRQVVKQPLECGDFPPTESRRRHLTSQCERRGTAPNGGAFARVFTLTHVFSDSGNLLAAGTLTGSPTDATGAVIGTITAVPIQIPLAANGSFAIFHLVLGPLDLDLLGLRVYLDQMGLNAQYRRRLQERCLCCGLVATAAWSIGSASA